MDVKTSHDAESGPAPGKRRWVSVVFSVIGVGLLAGAVYALVRQRETVEQAWNAARGASPVLIAACVLLPISNWLAASATIWVLTGRFGKVRFGEMTALIGAAWLLNLLPMRPGMVGRVAYHKKYNRIPVGDSVRVLVAGVLCTGCALALMLMMVVFASRARTEWAAGLLALPLALLAGAALALRNRGHVWRWPAAIGFRYVDMATWGVRYWLVFMLIGKPVGILTAGALTAVGQLAMLTPVQLGLREWAVGMASAALPGENSGGAIVAAAAPGLLADCVMRAAELLIVLPVGLTGVVWVWRRMRRGGE